MDSQESAIFPYIFFMNMEISTNNKVVKFTRIYSQFIG